MSSLLSLFSLVSILSLTSASASAYITTLSLLPAISAPPPTNPWQRTNHLVKASATRAHHLKHLVTNTTTTNVPLYPRGYGGYSISLNIGTPPQTLSFIMDTGSSLVWFPCTHRYACSSCEFSNPNPTNISTFIPKSSSSSKIVGCKNPKCRWIFPGVQCDECRKNDTTCAELCPPYIIQYGSGSTSGLLLSEILSFPGKSVNKFIIGCSLFSSRQPSGIAGFGRGPESLPVQMGLKRFSYCLVSHSFDDKPVSSDLILVNGASSTANGGQIMYTPFRKNPKSSNPAFQNYYYVTVRKITVGGVNVRAPHKYLVADSAGNGGTILDSGTTFTFMEKRVFDLVARELQNQVGKNYSRVKEIETKSGLSPCFNVSGRNPISLPQLSFHFRGGAQMDLPLVDYFSFLEDDESVICMTIITNSSPTEGGVGPGPAVILGNYQQQNFYMEYDLENERLGFHKQQCK